MSKESYLYLANVLGEALGFHQQTSSKERTTSIEDMTEAQWHRWFEEAKQHKVLGLAYPVIYDARSRLPRRFTEQLQVHTQALVAASFHLHALAYRVCSTGEQQGIRLMLLKGAHLASYYPYPLSLYRKSADIDLFLLDAIQKEEAVAMLQNLGFHSQEDEVMAHHLGFVNEDGISLELHLSLVEEYGDATMNARVQAFEAQMKEKVQYREILGYRFLVMDGVSLGVYTILHILQHFLRAGFGLRMLVDWVVIISYALNSSERFRLFRQLERMGLARFASLLSYVAKQYLCVSQHLLTPFVGEKWVKEGVHHFSADQIEAFFNEICSASEFGKSSKDRMVVMQGTRFKNYLKEFHHQMHLTYPKARKKPYLWPFLYPATLIGFLVRNHTIRHVDVRSIFKKAHERSQLMEAVALFQVAEHVGERETTSLSVSYQEQKKEMIKREELTSEDARGGAISPNVYQAAGCYWVYRLGMTDAIALNEVGVYVWEGLLKGQSPEEIATDLSKTYQIRWEDALADVEAFTRTLQKEL